MNPANQDLHLLATQEELKYRARSVLAAGRPVLASILITLLSLVGVSFGVAGSELPLSTKMLLCIVAVVPSLMLEIWYINRRLEASLVLLGLSRE